MIVSKRGVWMCKRLLRTVTHLLCENEKGCFFPVFVTLVATITFGEDCTYIYGGEAAEEGLGRRITTPSFPCPLAREKESSLRARAWGRGTRRWAERAGRMEPLPRSRRGRGSWCRAWRRSSTARRRRSTPCSGSATWTPTRPSTGSSPRVPPSEFPSFASFFLFISLGVTWFFYLFLKLGDKDGSLWLSLGGHSVRFEMKSTVGGAIPNL